MLFAGSVGRTDLGGDFPLLRSGIRAKLFMLPDATRVYPGPRPGHHDRGGAADAIPSSATDAGPFDTVMNVWAISDLHLSFGRPDRRDRYAARWRDHADKIDGRWREAVRPGDVVLLPGDLSMARNHRELQPDLEWLGALPGTKVLAPGNHDRWWNDDGVRPPVAAAIG